MNAHLHMKSWILRLAATVAVIAVVSYLLISGYVASVLVHTQHVPLAATPTQYGLAYADVQFESAVDRIMLKGWFIGSPDHQTILMLHGRNSNKANFINMEVGRALAQHGYNLFMFDFRGQGESSGDTGSFGQWETRDLDGALAYLKSRGITQIGSIGWSQGATTELLAAPDRPALRAGEGNPPDFFAPGILLMSKLMYGLNLLPDRPDLALARVVDRPILLIHSSGDDLIPVDQAYKLKQAGANDPNLSLWVAHGAGHVSAFADNKEEYLNRIFSFFDKYLGHSQ